MPDGNSVASAPTSAVIGGTHVDLRSFNDAVHEIMSAANNVHKNPLAVVSANLDHVMHFGTGSRWAGTLDRAASITWLTLLDGAPLRSKATQLTGQGWPRLAGSDLINPLLDEAEKMGLRVGFLGGAAQTHELLKEQFALHRPSLQVSGWWAPDRAELGDHIASLRLAGEVAQSGTDILVVGLGKPRQELWIAEYGALTGSRVLLAFGAVVDFLAGRIQRAPKAVSNAGLEWAWRLALEPRRLANRYLVQGPEAYLRMARHSTLGISSDVVIGTNTPQPSTADAAEAAPVMISEPHPAAHGAFVPSERMAEVTVVLVTYNNVDDIDPLITCLRAETESQSIKVLVADNGSTDGTTERVADHPDVILVKTGGNLGYAGGINAALRHDRNHHDVLILNPDLRIRPGAIRTLRRRMQASSAGMVVPRLLDDDGTTYTSLRREPGIVKSMGDAAFGQRLPTRPEWLSEIDFNPESYQFPHPVDWATGAAIYLSGETVADVGEWDERYFLYSEETDYFRRARELGHSVWFEPSAIMNHSRGGSGASAELVALMAVNRVRYAQAHHSRRYAALTRTVGATAELARAYKPGNRKAFLALAGAIPWKNLPRASEGNNPLVVPLQLHSTTHFPSGAVIIPAHNEAAVIARTLAPLADLAASGSVEVIVACNGCTDSTAAIAAQFPGVKVLDLKEPSKNSALNAADTVCSRWPRLYLDADIEITPTAVAAVFRHLRAPGALAARPVFRYDTSRADKMVQAYYRARMRIPAMNEHLWGAGAYAVSAEGHARFPQFPATTADDAYVDLLFGPEEKVILNTIPVVVRVPQTIGELHRTLRRIYRGNQDLNPDSGSASGLGNLISSITGPLALVDACIYASVAVSGKLRRGKSLTAAGGWDRDESSRTA